MTTRDDRSIQVEGTFSDDKIAEALTKLEKAIASGSKLEFVDPEVFLDGLATGRGWYDTRLDWDNTYVVYRLS